MAQSVNRDTFIKSLNLPHSVTVKHYDGMSRHSFKYKGDGFVSLDMQNDYYHLRTKEAYLKAINVSDYVLDRNHPVVPATIKKIPYENSEVMRKLVSYITGDVVDDINIPMKPKNRIRKSDGSVHFVCARCAYSFTKAPR